MKNILCILFILLFVACDNPSAPVVNEMSPMTKTDMAQGILYEANIRQYSKEGTFDDNNPIGSLDVSVLSKYILEPILNIKDLRTDTRIDFVGGIRGMEELERRCEVDCQVAFALPPVSIEQLLSVADSGQVMPPKSTWFEPKLRSGMVVRLLG